MVDINDLARKRGTLICNAAVASQNKTLIDDRVTTEAIELNIIAPLIIEISERDARIAALEAQLAEVRAVADILTRNITENGLDNHRMKINGEWHEGPVVDTCRDLLVAVRRSILSALEATPPAPKVTEAMVEAGCKAFLAEYGDPSAEWHHYRREVTAALTAAQEAGEP